MLKGALPGAILSVSILTACGGNMSPAPPPPSQTPPTVNASVTVSNTKTGAFDVALSTSFQPAEWDNTFFQSSASTKETLLGNLKPNHIRLQGVSKGVPQGTEGMSSSTWNFTILDDIVQPVLGVGDHSPEFQIAKAPPFMYVSDDSSKAFNDPGFAQFANYAKELVEYYDTGGFTDSGGTHVSAMYPNETITWWGIYNEPSINNDLTATDYVNMYNALVPAMQLADPSLKYVAMELCCGSENWVKTFAQNVTTGLPVDAVATHYYSSCNQKDTDAELFATVPGFASSIQTIYANLAANANLKNVPVWITENNVNADFEGANGMSTCNPGQVFVTDKRGSSPFFAAWRPYVFSQVGKAGARALYHWDFAADAQYGELNDSSGQTQLSYWVDYWLGQTFPQFSAGTAEILQSTNSDSEDIEVLPVVNPDNSVVILVSNHAVASLTDNNGAGLAAKVTLDVSALGSFSSASEMMIDAGTSPIAGPTPVSIAAQSPITVNFTGYGVALLTLK
jgi:Cellulase (glycosyl hydrolase family 5)